MLLNILPGLGLPNPPQASLYFAWGELLSQSRWRAKAMVRMPPTQPLVLSSISGVTPLTGKRGGNFVKHRFVQLQQQPTASFHILIWTMLYITTTSSNETTNGTNTTSGPSLNWETSSTSVDIKDDSGAFLCEVSFAFALHEGVVLKERVFQLAINRSLISHSKLSTVIVATAGLSGWLPDN